MEEILNELENLLGRCRKTGDRAGEAAALARIGNALRRKRKWPQAVTALQKARDIHTSLGDPAGQATTLACIGAVYWEQAQIKKAAAHLGEALELFPRMTEKKGQNIVTALFALSRWRQGDQAEALSLIGDALPSGTSAAPEPFLPLVEAMQNAAAQLENRITREETSGHPQRTLQAHLALVPLYLCLGNIESSASHHNQAKALAQETRDAKAIAILTTLFRLLP